MVSRRLRSFKRLVPVVVILTVLMCSILSLGGFGSNVYANDGNVETTFFGNLQDDGKGCGVYMVINFVIEIMTFGVGVAAAIGITIVGITYLTAGGNENQVIKAKRRIYEIVIGLVAYVILWAVLSFLLPGGTLNNSSVCKEGVANDSFFTTPVETPDRSKNNNKNGTNDKNGSNNNTSSVASQAKLNYQVYLSGKLNPSKLGKGSGIIVLDPVSDSSSSQKYTKKQLDAIKKKGYTVLAYLSIGSIEHDSNAVPKKYWKYEFKGETLDGWEDERVADLTKKPWQNFLISQAAKYKSWGYDGIWGDNVDSYEAHRTSSMFNAYKKVLTSLKKYGYLMVNGGSDFFNDAMKKKIKLKTLVDGVTQEEVFSMWVEVGKKKKILSQSELNSGKDEDGESYKSISTRRQKYMKKLKSNGVQTFLLEYTKDKATKKKIEDFCKKYGMTGYYYTSDIDLYPPSSLR